MSTVDQYLKEQLKAFTLNLLANKQCTQEDILSHFEDFSTSYTLAEGTLCVVLKELEQDNKIVHEKNEGESLYSLAISTSELPIFALSGYTPSEVAKKHSIEIFDSFEEIPAEVEEALINDSRKYAIFLRNNTYCSTPNEETNNDTTIENKEGTEVQPIDSIPVIENKKEINKNNSISEEVSVSSTLPEVDLSEDEVEELPAENEIEDPISRRKKLDALKLLGFFDEPKSEEDIAREQKEKEELENKKHEEERIARIKEEEKKRQALLAKQEEEKAKKEEFSLQQALSTRQSSEIDVDSSAMQRKLSKYIERKEIENKYNFETIINNVFTDVPQPLQIEEENDPQTPVSSYAELKDFMSNKGYTIKPYVNTNTFTYYSNNFIFTNKINRDVSIITYAFILIECLLGYFLIDKFVNKGFLLYLTFALIGLAIPIFFLVKYFVFPTKRKEALFKFRLSLATAFMIYANLIVLVVLFSVFTPALKVSTEDVSTMILPIFFPAVLLFNIPISVCIYSLLYRTKKYHLH